jgi:hypothetical protein
VARRRPVVAPVLADGVELVLPRELAYYDRDAWDTYTYWAYCRAKAEWFRSHGIDPSDWQQVSAILVASKRAHARTRAELSALDRRRLIGTGEQPEAG